ncbi:MAG: hypothetical protein QXY82_06870 [Desulfurococcaceae archaeon]
MSSLTIINALIEEDCSWIIPLSVALFKLEVSLEDPLKYEYRLKLANSVESFEGFKRGYRGGLYLRKNQSL